MVGWVGGLSKGWWRVVVDGWMGGWLVKGLVESGSGWWMGGWFVKGLVESGSGWWMVGWVGGLSKGWWGVVVDGWMGGWLVKGLVESGSGWLDGWVTCQRVGGEW